MQANSETERKKMFEKEINKRMSSLMNHSKLRLAPLLQQVGTRESRAEEGKDNTNANTAPLFNDNVPLIKQTNKQTNSKTKTKENK